MDSQYFLVTRFILVTIVLFSNIEYKEKKSTKRKRIKNDNVMHPISTCKPVLVCPSRRVTQAWVWNGILPLVERSQWDPIKRWSKCNIGERQRDGGEVR